MATYGYTTVGTAGETNAQDFGGSELVKSLGSALESGTATKLWARVHNTNGSDPFTLNLGLRSSAAGTPSTLLASGNPIGISVAADYDDWVSIDISQAITSGTEYFFCVYTSNGQLKIKHDSTGGGLTWQGVTSAPALDSGYSQIDGTGTPFALSVYVEYETAASKPPGDPNRQMMNTMMCR